MGLVLLYSTQREALRSACLHQVAARAQEESLNRSILVVPEQTKMDMERAFLRQSGQSGMMTADVLSFRRLSWRILDEIGLQSRQVLNPAGKAMLLHRVLRQEQDHLNVFGHLADKPGFMSQIAAVLGDLKRYRIDEKQLLETSSQISDKPLRDKTHDLAVILSRYHEIRQALAYTDADDDLDRLADILEKLASFQQQDWPWPEKRLSWLKQAYIWIYGFGEIRDFTPQEEAVIKGLADVSKQVTVTVSSEYIPADLVSVDLGEDIFLPGRRTAYRLQKSLPGLRIVHVNAPQTTIERKIEIALRGQSSFQDVKRQNNPVEQNTEKPTDPVGNTMHREKKNCTVHLVQAPSHDDELRWLAGEIRRLTQAGPYRYRDINIAVCQFPGDLPRLRSVFREYKIPLFMDAERALNGTPLMRFVLGLLDIDLTRWSRFAIMRCLRSGLSPLDSDQIDQLENEWLARGLFRQDRLFSDDAYHDHYLPVLERHDGEDDKDEDEMYAVRSSGKTIDPDQLIAWRDESLGPIRDVIKVLRDQPGIADKVNLFRRFLQEYGVRERLQEEIKWLVDAHEMDAAIALVQSWNELDRIFDQMVHFMSEVTVSLKTFRDTLSAGIDAAISGVIPSAVDQVSIGSLRRTLYRKSRILFLVGASSQNLPPSLSPEGLLKDPDRDMLSRLTGKQLPSNVRDQVMADTYILEAVLKQPSDHMYLTAPGDDLSACFSALAEQFPGSVQTIAELPGPKDARLQAPAPAMRWLLSREGLSSPDPRSDPLKVLLKTLMDQADFNPKPADPGDTSIAQNLVRAIYPEPMVLSVSQLEQYAACPFRHFAGRLLALSNRPEWKPQQTETGIVLHRIMEEAIRTIKMDLDRYQAEAGSDMNTFWEDWLNKDLDEAASGWIKQAVEHTHLFRLYDEGLRSSVLRRVRQVTCSSLTAILCQYQENQNHPLAVEWLFGPETQNALKLDGLADPPVYLRGKIDRVDQFCDQEKPSFAIIDYKSSQKTVDYDALVHGLALQLPIYVLAYARAHPGWNPADAAWLTLQRPWITLKGGEILSPDQLRRQLIREQKPTSLRLNSSDLLRLCDYACEQARHYARMLLSGSFAVLPSRLPGKYPCQYCDFRSICGFDIHKGPWRRLRLEKDSDEAGTGSQSKRERFLKVIHEEKGGH
jgi:ATP-dependent helicase/nuclease subunit B